MTNEKFLEVWYAVHIVKPSIHPDNAHDRSGPRKDPSTGTSPVFEPYYLRTGWPHYLIPIAEEAKHRFLHGEITKNQYYFHDLDEKAA
jgi:hypothetical protein